MPLFLLLLQAADFDRVQSVDSSKHSAFVSAGARIVRTSGNSSINPDADLKFGYKVKKAYFGVGISFADEITNGGIFVSGNPIPSLQLMAMLNVVNKVAPLFGVGFRAYQFNKDADCYLNFLMGNKTLAINVEFPYRFSF